MNSVSQESRLATHTKNLKKKDSLNLIGQSSLPILNRSGIYMYWNNCWLNSFNSKNFFNKTVFLEKLFHYIFSEKIFLHFFSKRVGFFTNNYIFKKFFSKKSRYCKNSRNTKQTQSKIITNSNGKRYSFTRL